MTGLLAAGLSGLAIFVSMSITASFIWFGENPDSAVPRARFDAVAALLPALAPVITLLLVLVLAWRRSCVDEPLSRSLRRALLVGAGAWAAGSGLAATFNPAVDAAGLAWFAPTVMLVAAVGVAAGLRAARRERRVMEAVHAMREARDLNEVLAAAAAVVDGHASAPLMILGVVEDEGEEVGGAGDAPRAVRVVLLATTAPLATPPGAAMAQLPSWMALRAGQGRWLDDRDLQVDERAQLRRQGIAACRWFPVRGAGRARGLLAIPASSLRRSSRARWLELVAHIEAQWQKLGLIARERASALQRERERVADAIHDNLAQDLAAAVISLETASIEARRHAPAIAAHLDRALGSARQSLREARRLVESGAAEPDEDLAPEAIAVAPVLEEVCRSWTRETGVPATLEQAGDPVVVGGDAGALLLRTLREALVNVRKHAAASSVHVRLRAADAAIALEIEDDGAGPVPAAARRRGHGLASLAVAAHRLGGDLSLEPAPPRGARLTLSLPSLSPTPSLSSPTPSLSSPAPTPTPSLSSPSPAPTLTHTLTPAPNDP